MSGMFDVSSQMSNYVDNQNYVDAAELNYFMGNVTGFKKYQKAALGLGLDPESIGAKRLEKYNNDIGMYLNSSINYYRNVDNEWVIPQVPSVIGKDPGQPVSSWDIYERDSEGNYVFIAGEKKATSREVNGVNANMNHAEILHGVLNWGVDLATMNYMGTDTEYMTFLPWIDKNTPDYLKLLDGTKHKLLENSNIYTYRAYLNHSFSMFDIAPNAGIFPVLINKVNLGVNVLNTRTNLTTYNNFTYDRATQDLKSDAHDTEFSSFRIDVPMSAETRTFPIFEWPNQMLLSFGGGVKFSSLSSNMPDKYYWIEQNAQMPESFKGIPMGDLTVVDPAATGGTGDPYYKYEDLNENGVQDAGEPLVRDSSAASGAWNSGLSDYLAKRRNAKMPSANEFNLNVKMGLPTFISEEKLNVGFTFKWGSNGIDATNNGIMPHTRNLLTNFGRWVSGDTNRDGVVDTGETWAYDDLNGNGTRDNGEEYRYESGFLGDPSVTELKPQEMTTKELSLSYMPKIVSMGKGQTVYLPLEATFGWQDIKDPNVGDGTFYGSYMSLGAGIKYRLDSNNDFQFMYYYGTSDNGYNYNSISHKIRASWTF